MNKNKLFSVTLSLLLLVPGAGMAQNFGGGKGTKDSPWLITTAQHLYSLRNYTGAAHSDKYFKLGADIHISASSLPWTPVGMYDETDATFAGHLDGDGHRITGLRITTSVIVSYRMAAGMFGAIDGGSVRNLGVEANVTVTVAADILGMSVGSLAGYVCNAVIENCYATASITNTSNSSLYHVGALAGESENSRYTDCHASGTVSATNDHAGGSANAGGLIGSCENDTLERCHATGAVSASATTRREQYWGGSARAGGLVGWCQNSIVTNCYATGAATAAGYCYSFAGGLVGSQSYGGNTTNCYATGTATATVVAKNPSNDAGGAWAGGLAGDNLSSNIVNCYFLKAGGNTNGIGRLDEDRKTEATGLSDAEMKRGASFPGFDFDAVWTIDEGRSFPALRFPVSVGNEPVRTADAAAVWSYGGNLHVRTDRPAMLTVYSVDGALIRQQTVGAAETATLPLPQGIYIVKLGDTTAKVTVKY
jgi:hypothetical protein